MTPTPPARIGLRAIRGELLKREREKEREKERERVKWSDRKVELRCRLIKEKQNLF